MIVPQFIGDQTIKHLIKENVLIKGANIIVMGLTFKENCSDVRNSKVIDLINYLNDYGVVTHIYDPVASEEQAFKDFGLRLFKLENLPASAAMIAAVPHQEILELTIENIEEKLLPDGLYVDVKAKLDKEELIKKEVIMFGGYSFEIYSELQDYQLSSDLQNILLNDSRHYLVTGGAGFIGSNIVEMLLRLNQRVTSLDNFSTGHEKNLIQVKNLVGPDNWKNHNLIKGDISDIATCVKACKGVDVVLHQAALGST